MTPFEAVKSGDLDALRSLGDLRKPADDLGWLLRAAVDANRPEVLEFLLAQGLDPDAKVPVPDGVFTWGMPLYECVRAHRYAMAEMLLEAGADPNGQVYASGTPLSEAYGQCDERMIDLLVRYGGKPNASMAGFYRRMDLALRMLAEHGDQDLPDDGFARGPVAEQLIGAAARGGDPDILRLGLDRVSIPPGDPRWTGWLTAPLGFWNHWIGPWCHPEWGRGTYLACFQMLLERSGPPLGRLPDGATVLHSITAMGDHVRAEERVAFAEAALDAGARLDARDDRWKSTPLGWACRQRRVELVRLLLARGADPVEADTDPATTPLAWAQGSPEIEALLNSK